MVVIGPMVCATSFLVKAITKSSSQNLPAWRNEIGYEVWMDSRNVTFVDGREGDTLI